jgi:hypothetical protein
MRVLLYSALLYLVGVVTVLFLKPAFMFNEDGTWKEFGISSSKRSTWFPVWLFCIVWAVISFAIIKVSLGVSQPSRSTLPTSKKLKPGYYVLNQDKVTADGVPRYVYIGEDSPE